MKSIFGICFVFSFSQSNKFIKTFALILFFIYINFEILHAQSVPLIQDLQYNPGAGIVQNGAKAQSTWCNEPELFLKIHVLNAEGPFFAWIFFRPELEVQSWDLPQDVTIIDP